MEVQYARILDFTPLMPELIVLITAITVMLVDMFGERKERNLSIAVVSVLGLLLAMGFEVLLWPMNAQGFRGVVMADPFSILFELFYLGGTILVIMVSLHYLEERKANYGEYFALLLFSVVGMMVMTSTKDLMLIFIGVEIMSISSYVMVGMLRQSSHSIEAALKYLMLGAFSSAFLLFGIAMLYGASGSTVIPAMVEVFSVKDYASNPLVRFGLALVLIGVGFKVALVPFHMWTPDVYTGAPTPVAGFMSAVVKAAGFAVMVRLFLTGMPEIDNWENVLWVMAAVTMTLGNLQALKQTLVKRMLAYSSIAHAGYVLVGIVVGTEQAIGSVIFYSVAYGVMAIGAFGVLSLKINGKQPEVYEDLGGIVQQSPLVAAMMTVFMLSLIGIPLTAGFMGKFQIFAAAIEGEYYWLTLVALVNSVISVYYYLKVIIMMYMKPIPVDNPDPRGAISGWASPLAITGLMCGTLAVIYLGMFPGWIIRVMQHSASTLF